MIAGVEPGAARARARTRERRLTMPFEWVVALRFLREGRFQTALIVGGAAVGVAVVIFITALVNGLQANTIKRTLGTQAHIVIRPPRKSRGRSATPAPARRVLPRVEARAQRLRSIDQWQALEPVLERDARDHGGVADGLRPGVRACAATRTSRSRSVGVEPARYDRIVALDDKLVARRVPRRSRARP